MICRLTLSLIFLPAISSTATAQWIPHSTRARPVCCLPDRHDYSYNRLTNPVTAISFDGVIDTSSTLRTNIEADSMPTALVKSYPLRQKELRIDHCQLSKVVVTITDSGEWTIDMLAEQNPELLSREDRPRIQLYHQNRLHVTVRPLIGSGVTSASSLDNVVTASVCRLKVPPFWLEKGQSEQIHFSGMEPLLAERFNTIRNVQIDLQYE